MKRFITLLAITSTLAVAQGCAKEVKSGETPNNAIAVADTNPHHGHNMSDDKVPETGSHHHEGDSNGEKLESANATAKLNLPTKITPTQPASLAIEIQDKEGKPIANFDKFQEKLMHLIVVSDNLQSFDHIHPTYKGNGRFEVQANFPNPGYYTLFSDYKVTGKAEEVSVLKAQIPGKSTAAPKIDLTKTKTFGKTKVNLKYSQPTLKAGQDIHLIFNLLDTTSNKSVNDLQPYLGERGHLVIIKQSSPLTKVDYIHAHAMKNTPAGEIHFMTNFPKPGKYKMWGQFNRNGKIVTADFWVDVQ